MLALPPATLLQVTRADVGRMLRADALSLSLGVLLVAVGVGFGSYPAWLAARLAPMDALRHE